jgi:arsenate reductase
MTKIYGIKNCDTVKKALKFMDASDSEYEFVDFKKIPPTKEDIKRWQEVFGDLPVNKRGTTFRKIKEEWEKATEAGRIKLLLENTSAIKRPIAEGKKSVLGFNEEEWKHLL